MNGMTYFIGRDMVVVVDGTVMGGIWKLGNRMAPFCRFCGVSYSKVRFTRRALGGLSAAFYY